MASQRINKDLLMGFIKSGYTDIVIPNFFYNQFECDLFKISKLGYTTEFELKVSRSDYKADFLKTKFTGDWDKGEVINKHNLIKSGQRTNRFFFVVPKGLIDISEIPEYAGLIYQDDKWFQYVKNAPLIHRNTIDSEFYKKCCLTLCFREENLRKKISRNG